MQAITNLFTGSSSSSSSSSSSVSLPTYMYVDHHLGTYKFTVHPRYTHLRPLGKGAYGLVASARDTFTGRPVAIKKMSHVFLDLTDAKRIMREIKLLRHFSAAGKPHENIIDIIDIMTSPPECEDFDELYIVMELFEADLTRILGSKQALSDHHVLYFTYQIFRGLRYIHSAHILHRDLKPSNLLVNSNCDLAICDFGLARGISYESMTEEELTRYVQTRWYRAPELLCQATSYGPPMDIWSVGCILGEILLRQPILQGNSSANELALIIQLLGTPNEEDLLACHPSTEAITFVHHLGYFPSGNLPKMFQHCNPLAVDLLAKTLVFNPDKRISTKDAMEHPFFKDLHARAPPSQDCHTIFDYHYEDEWAVEENKKIIPKAAVQRLIFMELQNLRKETVQKMKGGGALNSTNISSSSSTTKGSSNTKQQDIDMK